MGYFFHFSSLYPATYIELYMCLPIWISYLSFKAVLALPKMACSAQTHESISFIWIVWSTLYVYLWATVKLLMVKFLTGWSDEKILSSCILSGTLEKLFNTKDCCNKCTHAYIGWRRGYSSIWMLLQLSKFETDPYFLQNYQCTTMFISAFCKICELNSEREIVFVFCNV